MRKHQIIDAVESETGQTLDSNWDESILCDGDTCRHSECECWDDFRDAVEEQLMAQYTAEKIAEYLPLYNAEKRPKAAELEDEAHELCREHGKPCAECVASKIDFIRDTTD